MSAIPKVTGWHAGFLEIMPAVEVHAKIQFRKLASERREEMIQETIAAACLHYHRAAVQGKLKAVRPSMLADFAVRHARTGRHVGGVQDRSKDVLSPKCHRKNGVGIQSICAKTIGHGTDGWRHVTISDRKVPVADLAAFRIDFACWLRTLCRKDRRIIAALIAGHKPSFVAQRFGMSAPRVSQLRRKYQRLWSVFHGESVEQ